MSQSDDLNTPHTTPKEEELPATEEEASGNETMDEDASPQTMGEQSESGHMPDPASDDDTLENAQEVGIAQDADPEHPKELNIAEDVEEAEESRRDPE